MNDVRVESFKLNGEEVNTTVIDIRNENAIDDHLSSFLRSSNETCTKVIGFDIQCTQYFKKHFCPTNFVTFANMNFCVGHSCLIIRLMSNSGYNVPSFTSVENFLSLPEYTFVGVGIKDSLAKLEKKFGIGSCRNAVELGPMAACLMNMPRLSFCGVDELAYVVNKLDLREHRPLGVNFNWGRDLLCTELVKLATVNVYSYYKIGSTLLGRDALIPPQPPFKKENQT